jgi:hypothetical protein
MAMTIILFTEIFNMLPIKITALLLLTYYSTISSTFGSEPDREVLDAFARMHQSHIDANAPSQAVFKQYLQRDLDKHFSLVLKKPVTTKIDLFYKEALHIGVGYPWYYPWVQIFDAHTGKIIKEGLAQVKAVDKTHFEPGRLIDAKDIKQNPKTFPDFFPQELCDGILERAKAYSPNMI